MDIDWDALANSAENTPRVALAEWQDGIDDVKALIVIALDEKDDVAYSWCWGENKVNGLVLVGMLERVKQIVIDSMRE